VTVINISLLRTTSTDFRQIPYGVDTNSNFDEVREDYLPIKHAVLYTENGCLSLVDSLYVWMWSEAQGP